MLIIRSSLHCGHFLCLPGIITALPVVKVTRKLDKPLDVMSQFQSIICACGRVANHRITDPGYDGHL